MTEIRCSRKWSCALAGAAVLATFVASSPTKAQDSGVTVTLGAPKSVDLNTAPELPTVPQPPGLVISRPAMPMADYLAAKNAAAARQMPGQTRTGAAAPPPASGVSLFTQVAGPNEGQTSGGNRFPPDGDIATSADWMVQVVNDLATMYNWNTNAFKQVTLGTLFQDATSFLFAPRVIWDPYWNRFVVLAGACTSCGTAGNVSTVDLAVSQSGDPTGAWWIASFVFTIGNSDFVDFPQLGMDLDSILYTYNLFHGATTYAYLVTFDKAHLYNGFGPYGTFFQAGHCTLAPPYVIDRASVDYLLSFCPNDTNISIRQLTQSSTNGASLTQPTQVSALLSGVPPDAQQPGTTYTLNTGDNRFENRSLQLSGRLLNTATVNSSGSATPAVYVFDTSADSPTATAASRSACRYSPARSR